MKAKSKQSGLTLTEMAVVIAIIAMLVGLGLPAIRALLASFESQSSTKSMISAALSGARAIAAREQRYAGLRFQKAYHPEDALEAPQYMIFIEQDPNIMAYGFRAVKGLKPIKLPDSVGVTDLTVVTARNVTNPVNSTQAQPDDSSLSNIAVLADINTFSIVFSPSGKLVVHGIQVRNKDGRRDTAANVNSISNDMVFNKKDMVKKDKDDDIRRAMFCQDDYYGRLNNPYPDLGLGPEPSRNSLVIYQQEEFKQAYDKGRAWSNYLAKLVSEMIYINPYTGTIISPD